MRVNLSVAKFEMYNLQQELQFTIGKDTGHTSVMSESRLASIPAVMFRNLVQQSLFSDVM